MDAVIQGNAGAVFCVIGKETGAQPEPGIFVWQLYRCLKHIIGKLPGEHHTAAREVTAVMFGDHKPIEFLII